MVTESIEGARRKQLPYVLVLCAFFGVFCCIELYDANIRELRLLDARGVPGVARVAGFVPAHGRRAPQYIYELDVGGQSFSGASVYWDAVKKSFTSPASVGDPVTVYYLVDRPSINRPGNPRDQLGVWYLLLLFFATTTLASACGSIVLFKRKRSGNGMQSAGSIASSQ